MGNVKSLRHLLLTNVNRISGLDTKGINPDFHRTGRYGNFPGKLAEILFKTRFCCPNRTYRQLIGR